MILYKGPIKIMHFCIKVKIEEIGVINQ